MVIFREMDVFIHSFASAAREKKFDIFGTDEIPKKGMSEEIDMFVANGGISQERERKERKRKTSKSVPTVDIPHNQKRERKKRKISNSLQKTDIHRKRGKKRGRDRRNITSRAHLDISRRTERVRSSETRVAATVAYDSRHLEPLDIISDLGLDIEITRPPQLPIDMVFELLSKLPTKKLFQCTCVSKVWSSIIHDNRFAKFYSDRNTTLCLVMSIPQPQVSIPRPQVSSLWFGGIPLPQVSSLWCGGVHPRIYSTSFDAYESANLCNLKNSRLGVTQVVNGLFCYYFRCDVVLANVFTHETMTLPVRRCNIESSARSQYYFGFDPVRGVYRLLSIRSRGHSHPWRVEILTIGRDSSWRELGNGDALPDDGFDRQSTCVNGVLYWMHAWKYVKGSVDLSTEKYRVYFFDLSTEKFGFVPMHVRDGGFVHFRGRLAIAGPSQSDSLAIYTLEDDQNWCPHLLSLPTELWYEESGRDTYIGNMPSGEIVLVDQRAISDADPSDADPLTQVYIYDNIKFKRSDAGKLPWLHMVLGRTCHIIDRNIVSVAFMQQNIATLGALVTS